MRHLRRLALVSALAMGTATGLLVTAGPARASNAGDAAAFVSYVNSVRAGQGLGALAVDPRLSAIAQGWAAQMSGSSTLAHNPNLVAQAPPGWTVLGENVGDGPSDPAIEAAFVASPHHYANMVDPRFTAIGVGAVESNGLIWVTEDFMAA